MNVNYSNLDSIFTDAGTDMLTLGDIIENREIMSDHAIKEASRLFLSEMYKGKGPRPNMVEQIKNYNGIITDEMTKICIKNTPGGYKCRCKDSNIITTLRSQLKCNKKPSKTPKHHKVYNSLAEYFEAVTNSISLYTYYKSLRGKCSIKFTEDTYRNIAMGFAKDLELETFFNNYGLTDKILNYKGPILQEFKKIELYKTPAGVHLSCTEQERIHTCAVMKNWETMFVSPQSKKCSSCGRELPVSAFYKDMHRPDMLTATCKECRNKKTKIVDINLTEKPAIQKVTDIQKEVKPEYTFQNIPGVTLPDIHFDLSACPIQDILQELRSRGYEGEIKMRI